MKVIILSQEYAEQYCKINHSNRSIMISISSTYSNELPKVFISNDNNIVDILRLKFNDTENIDPTYHGITVQHAIEIKQFIDKYYNSNIEYIIIHCYLGQNRSAGIAAAILEYFGQNSDSILNRDTYKHNMLCYNVTRNTLIKEDKT